MTAFLNHHSCDEACAAGGTSHHPPFCRLLMLSARPRCQGFPSGSGHGVGPGSAPQAPQHSGLGRCRPPRALHRPQVPLRLRLPWASRLLPAWGTGHRTRLGPSGHRDPLEAEGQLGSRDELGVGERHRPARPQHPHGPGPGALAGRSPAPRGGSPDAARRRGAAPGRSPLPRPGCGRCRAPGGHCHLQAAAPATPPGCGQHPAPPGQHPAPRAPPGQRQPSRRRPPAASAARCTPGRAAATPRSSPGPAPSELRVRAGGTSSGSSSPLPPAAAAAAELASRRAARGGLADPGKRKPSARPPRAGHPRRLCAVRGRRRGSAGGRQRGRCLRRAPRSPTLPCGRRWAAAASSGRRHLQLRAVHLTGEHLPHFAYAPLNSIAPKLSP